ncbi:hypothetical protein GYA49_05580 [Candidatus Beckwithbacteria bacterium]|nr:hypothetical protein [Candidatus Beckwithbacteria bacterium]
MFKTLLATIVKEKIPCFFISPHLDDAALSAGDLIAYLSSKTKVTVITVFTKGSEGPYTLSGRQHLKVNGYQDLQKLFADRRVEDREVFKLHNVKVEHLPYTDASFRKKQSNKQFLQFLGKLLPEFLHVYPTYRWHVLLGQVAKEENTLINQISDQLARQIPKKAVVFAPLGVGKHVDHIIIRKVCSKLARNVVYWLDFPYGLKEDLDTEFIKTNQLIKTRFSKCGDQKKTMIKGYKTQIFGLFPKGLVPDLPEYYFTHR